MLLKPKKFKHFKIKKKRLHSYNYNTKNLTKGSYGLRALDYARLTSKQIETVYMAINRFLDKQTKTYIKIFPDVSITSKSIASRMGKGKGEIKDWVCLIRPGKILYEISDISEDMAYTALNYGASKLNIKTKIIKLKKFN